MLCLKLQLPGRLVFMFCVYRPPSADDSIYDVMSEKIDAIQELHPRSEIIVLGDMNAHHEEWLGSKQTDGHGECALEFAVLNLHQLVDVPTGIGKDGNCSKLDLFLTTSPDNHVVTVSAPLGSSDHCVVSTVAQYRLLTPSKPVKRKVWLYDKADWDGMRSYLADSNKTSAVPPLIWDGQIYNKAKDKAELLNNIFTANAHLDDSGKSPPTLP